ncbi:MAG: oxygen-dependent coproporphyrinogen oxidase [Simkaniaceae bacterium]|nr:MAG: oxygen-dependent coproporphyrinogen oxidase [Simkaniaceae bacterium]
MMQTACKREEKIVDDLKSLRDEIIAGFENFEPEARFERKEWDHHSGGGGEISVIRGDVFEKAAVNWSGVRGTKLPFNDEEEPFFATGVSLITHMKNPFMPTVHMNIRYIRTGDRWWFGGGYDLTPMGFDKNEDTEHFHGVAKKALGGPLYNKFSKNAADYYYIKHWKKERGVGGIFFDYYNTGDFEKDYEMWKEVGSTFLDAILPIYEKRKNTPYTEKDKAMQNRLRAHYVEFNLLYDRGTKFGFVSGGNPEAILCSMPPTATW